MYADNAVIHNHAEVISFAPMERPVVAQLGGSDPALLARAAKICIKYGYHEINLNVSLSPMVAGCMYHAVPWCIDSHGDSCGQVASLAAFVLASSRD